MIRRVMLLFLYTLMLFIYLLCGPTGLEVANGQDNADLLES